MMWQCMLLLRTASLLVPRPARANWYKEWYGEIWHWLHFLAESNRLTSHAVMELFRHCWGAFPDAAWHRFDQKKALRAFEEVPRRARFCLTVIGSALLFLVLATGLAPTLRSAFKPLPYTQPDRLAYFSLRGGLAQYMEQSLFESTRNWWQQSKTASAVAGYSWRPAMLNHGVRDVSARVSPNFFDVLGTRAELGRTFLPDDPSTCPQCVVITDRLWSDEFQRDRNIIGKTISVDQRDRIVIGVLPENFAFIYPEVSVWLVPQPEAALYNFPDRTGAIVRMTPHTTLSQAADEFGQFVQKNASTFENAHAHMEAFVATAHQGAKLYLFFTVLTLLGGIALGSRLGGAKTRKLKLSLRHTLRWWGFFTAKTLLLLAICFVASLEITGRLSMMLSGSIHPMVGPVSTWLFLVTAMIALSWSLHDQSRRCRLCLNRLGNEASVGMPGYLLLGWWGTELVCADGHGLLHVPEMKSSWQQFDQWVSLDESWKPLFEPEEAVHTP
ncbi:MAG TPA: ABC transporter permease [Candidatus Angelobacter sp.]|nr:ABC transporter permease [Candidatus Angelobacter sp.]